MELDQVLFGPFRLDRRRRTLWRDGKTVELGQRACDILCTLIAAKGAVVSKDALMAGAWPGQIVEENTVQAQISLLRKALGEAGQRCIITVPGRGYRLVVEGAAAKEIAPAEEEEAVTSAVIAGPTCGQPSIAVLPFANLSGNQDDEWLADGIAEDLIIELSRSHWFLVISRNSSFTFKCRPVDVRQVGQELGVRYVVEGSLRRSGDRLRVAVQLTDGERRTSVWAERYDRALTDLFALQDEITHAVAHAIKPVVESAEHSRILRKRPGSLDAWEAWQRARLCCYAEEWEKANRLLRRSIELDPGFAAPHAERGYMLFAAASEAMLPFREALTEAEAEAYEAVKFDSTGPLGYAVLAFCMLARGNSADAMRQAARAEKLSPSDWVTRLSMVAAAVKVRDYAAAEQHLATLRLINPSGIGPTRSARRVTPMCKAILHFLRGEYELAAVEAEAVVASNANFPQPYWIVISSLGHLGRRDEAQSLLARWVAMAPSYSALLSELGLPLLAPEDSSRALAGLRAAGWNG